MINKVNSVTEGVEKLLRLEECAIPEFSIRKATDGECFDTLVFDGREIPLLESRYEPRIAYLARYGTDTELNSALNVYSFVGSDISLKELMIKEMDIAEYVLHAKIHSITAFTKPHSVNMILVMDNGTAANIDIGNTMAPGSMNQCQHRLITSKGTACDRGAGEYVSQSVLNVFASDNLAAKTYDDDQYYLFGLSEKDVCKATAAFAVLSGKIDASSWEESLARYNAASRAVYESDRLNQTIVL